MRRQVALTAASMATAGMLAVLLSAIGPPVPRTVLGLFAAAVLLIPAVTRRDVGLRLVVSQAVARRGPLTAAVAFGAAFGLGLTRQNRGYWAALIVLIVGSHLVLPGVVGLLLYAVGRTAWPVLGTGCRDAECVMVRVGRLSSLIKNRVVEASTCALALGAVGAWIAAA
jgi:hypothetical protein